MRTTRQMYYTWTFYHRGFSHESCSLPRRKFFTQLTVHRTSLTPPTKRPQPVHCHTKTTKPRTSLIGESQVCQFRCATNVCIKRSCKHYTYPPCKCLEQRLNGRTLIQLTTRSLHLLSDALHRFTEHVFVRASIGFHTLVLLQLTRIVYGKSCKVCCLEPNEQNEHIPLCTIAVDDAHHGDALWDFFAYSRKVFPHLTRIATRISYFVNWVSRSSKTPGMHHTRLNSFGHFSGWCYTKQPRTHAEGFARMWNVLIERTTLMPKY